MSDFLGKLVESLKSVIGYGNKKASYYWRLFLYKENGQVNCICASANAIVEVNNLPVSLDANCVYNYMTNAWEEGSFPIGIDLLRERAKISQNYSHLIEMRRKEIGMFMENNFNAVTSSDPHLSELQFRVVFSSPQLNLSDGQILLEFEKDMLCRSNNLEFSPAESDVLEIIPLAKYVCLPTHMDEATGRIFVRVLYPWSEATATIIDSRGKLYIPDKAEFLPHLIFPAKSVKPLFSMDEHLGKIIPETHVDGGTFMYATNALNLTNSGAININFTLNPLHPIMIWDKGEGMEVKIIIAPLMQNTGIQWR